MTTHPAPAPRPAAVAAFLRGLERRARLLAHVQAGDAGAGQRALAVTARVFTDEAGQWPLAQWPRQYWRLLLSAPAMAQASHAATSPLPGIARLAPPVRAALLLQLVAALEDDDAAAALGIGVDAYQQRIRDALPRTPLGQPDADVWRAWRAAAQRALDALPDPPPEVPHAAAPAPAGSTRTTPDPRQRRLRWLWLGVALCAVALVASFFLHPRGRELLDDWSHHVRVDALPPATAPKAKFDPADPRMQPDPSLLAAPLELQLARQLPLLAWLAAEAGDTLPMDAAAPVAAPAGGNLAERQRDGDRLSPRARAEQRAAWADWQALTDAERQNLRATARRFAALAPDQQQALRQRYAQLSFDAHRGWHLGPQLGRDWPRISALFALVDASERAPLLRLLRDASPADIDALARLAQSTPAEARAQLRRELLAQPAAQRGAWLQARLQY